MALFPCAVGLHRYSGPQRSAYLGLASDSNAVRSKMRLCASHFATLSKTMDEFLTLVAIGDIGQTDESSDSDDCRVCSAPATNHRVYATLYDRGDEPHAYFGRLCEKHLEAFSQVAQIDVT